MDKRDDVIDHPGEELGSDTEFLRSNREKYESCRNELKKIQVKQMILRGDTKRARQEFREIKICPYISASLVFYRDLQ